MSNHNDTLPLRLATAWLVQYLKLRRTSEETAEMLKKRAEDFELVPVPKNLLKEIAASAISEDTAHTLERSGENIFKRLGVEMEREGRSFWKEIPEGAKKSAIPAKRLSEIQKVIHAFGACLEKGDTGKAMRLLSADYCDPDRKSRNEMKAALTSFFKSTSGRRFIFVSIDDVFPVGNRYAATVNGAWEAKIKKKTNGLSLGEFFKLEFILNKEKGGIKISGIKKA